LRSTAKYEPTYPDARATRNIVQHYRKLVKCASVPQGSTFDIQHCFCSASSLRRSRFFADLLKHRALALEEIELATGIARFLWDIPRCKSMMDSTRPEHLRKSDFVLIIRKWTSLHGTLAFCNFRFECGLECPDTMKISDSHCGIS